MKPLAFGKVKEVKEFKDQVLMPLSPLDHRTTHFFATIITDLVKKGYKKKELEYHFKDFLKNNSLANIMAYVEQNGRMIWKDCGKKYNKGEEIIIPA